MCLHDIDGGPSMALVRTLKSRSLRLTLGLAINALSITLVMSSSPASGSPAVPNPTVSGPIAATAAPGDPSHDYPFFSTDFPIYSQGFIEQEFFLQGTANVYDATASQLTTANVVSSGHAYKTRMVVRRPADPKRFNGTVVVEWYNVSAGVDVESDWLQGWQEFVRDGYAWVGVSVQRVGVN